MSSPTGFVKKGPSLKVLNVVLSSKRTGRGIFSIIIDAPWNREWKFTVTVLSVDFHGGINIREWILTSTSMLGMVTTSDSFPTDMLSSKKYCRYSLYDTVLLSWNVMLSFQRFSLKQIRVTTTEQCDLASNHFILTQQNLAFWGTTLRFLVSTLESHTRSDCKNARAWFV